MIVSLVLPSSTKVIGGLSRGSSVVERHLGKMKVAGPIPASGSRIKLKFSQFTATADHSYNMSMV